MAGEYAVIVWNGPAHPLIGRLATKKSGDLCSKSPDPEFARSRHGPERERKKG